MLTDKEFDLITQMAKDIQILKAQVRDLESVVGFILQRPKETDECSRLAEIEMQNCPICQTGRSHYDTD